MMQGQQNDKFQVEFDRINRKVEYKLLKVQLAVRTVMALKAGGAS